MSERQHHPACAARNGGLCTQCPTVVKDAAGHEPDIRCLVCNETYIIAGESTSARRAALAAWQGCCTQTPAGDVGEAPSPAGSDADPDSSALSPVRQAAGEKGALPSQNATSGKSRPSLLSGVPAFVARRWAVGR